MEAVEEERLISIITKQEEVVDETRRAMWEAGTGMDRVLSTAQCLRFSIIERVSGHSFQYKHTPSPSY